ncbi:hypothetical protein T02_172, partial [Trichinella nativa]
MISDIIKSQNSCWKYCTTRLMCIITQPQIWILSLCEPISTAAMFLTALDCSITILIPKPKFCISNENVNRIILATIGCIFFCIALIWIELLIQNEELLSSCCHFREVISSNVYLANYAIQAFVGYISGALFLTAVMKLHLKKMESQSVQLIRLKREKAVIKQSIALISFAFFIKTLPSLVSVLLILKIIGMMQYTIIRGSCLFGYVAYAAYIIVKDKTFWKYVHRNLCQTKVVNSELILKICQMEIFFQIY